MKTKVKVLWAAGSVAAAAGLAGAGALLLDGEGDRRTVAMAVPVRTAVATRQDIRKQTQVVGFVRPLREVTLRTQIDGQLVKLHAQDGQSVRRGQLLATIDDRHIRVALERARASLAMHEAELKAAELDLDRYRRLVAQDAVSSQTVDQQEATVGQLRATVRSDRAAIAAEEVRLSYTRLHSPIDGRTGIRNVDEGNFVRVADTAGLLTVTQVDPVTVEFTIPQPVLAQVDAPDNAPAGLEVAAVLPESGAALGSSAKIVFDNRLSDANGTLRAKAEFPNREGKFWPGQFVNVRLQTGVVSGAVVVPAAALREGQDGPYLWRVSNDKAEMIRVQVIYRDSEIAGLTEVREGDAVVVDGHSRLRAGAPVAISGQGAGGLAAVKRGPA